MRNIALTAVFFGLAMVTAGCSDSHMAAMDAASNNGAVQPSNYQTGYGFSSAGPTTDLYTELKGSLQRPERPQATGAVQQASSVGANGQQVAASSTSAAAPADPPREESTPSAYGISSNGPTTDLYTELFGARQH